MPVAGRQKGKRKDLFSLEEDALIRKLYNKDRPLLLTKLHRRPYSSIRARAHKLGVAKVIGARPVKVKTTVEIVGLRGPREIHPSAPIPVPERTRRLAEFDPVIARVVREYDMGLPPGALRYAGVAI